MKSRLHLNFGLEKSVASSIVLICQCFDWSVLVKCGLRFRSATLVYFAGVPKPRDPSSLQCTQLATSRPQDGERSPVFCIGVAKSLRQKVSRQGSCSRTSPELATPSTSSEAATRLPEREKPCSQCCTWRFLDLGLSRTGGEGGERKGIGHVGRKGWGQGVLSLECYVTSCW